MVRKIVLLSLSLSLSLSHTHTHTHAHKHAHAHTHTLSISLSHTFPLFLLLSCGHVTLTHTILPSLWTCSTHAHNTIVSVWNCCTHILSLSLSHSLTHAHARTCTSDVVARLSPQTMFSSSKPDNPSPSLANDHFAWSKNCFTLFSVTLS